MKINVLSLTSPRWRIVDATPVVIPGYEEFSFCITPAIEPLYEEWVQITEVTTGTRVGFGGKDADAAIADALDVLNKHSKDHIRSSIDDCVARYGTAPQVINTDEEVPSERISDK